MVGGSKLARRMELKKRIEEEYRMAEERGRVERVAIYEQYWERLGISREENEEVKYWGSTDTNDERLKIIKGEEQEKEDKIIAVNDQDKAGDVINEVNKTLLSMTDPEKYQTISGNQMKKKYIKKILKRGNIDGDGKETDEMKETKEVEHLQEQEASQIKQSLIIDKEIVVEDKKFEAMETIEDRIKELELSIASLDNDLERFEIERMKHKTRQVVKRMKKALGQTEKNEGHEVLKVKNVTGLIKDKILWQKYMATDNCKL